MLDDVTDSLCGGACDVISDCTVLDDVIARGLWYAHTERSWQLSKKNQCTNAESKRGDNRNGDQADDCACAKYSYLHTMNVAVRAFKNDNKNKTKYTKTEV